MFPRWPLVVILILGFFCPLLLFLALIIFPTLSADKEEKVSLICKMSSMLVEMLAFEACAYDFLTIEGFKVLFLMFLTILLREGGTPGIGAVGGVATDAEGPELLMSFGGEEDVSLLSSIFLKPNLFLIKLLSELPVFLL